MDLTAPLTDILGAKIREMLASFGSSEPRDLHTRVLAMVETMDWYKKHYG